MAEQMTRAERRAFLLDRARTGKLAVVRSDGSPHVAPIWFDLDDDDCVVFTTGADTVRGRSIRREGRVSMCVDDESPPFAFVRIDGTAEVSEDLDEMLAWATRIAARYMGADKAESYGRRNAVPGELLVRVKPMKVVAESGVSD
jgi:hypothetical protein